MKVYISSVENLFTNRAYSHMLAKVCEKRQRKAQKLVKLESRVLCVYAELLLQSVYPQKTFNGFEYDKYGKPYITGGVPFSISHSGNFVAAAVTQAGCVGVDIQLVGDINERIFEKVLSDGEKEFLSTVKDRRDAFFKLWVLKEAAVKAIGMGFKLSPKNIECADASGIKKFIVYNGKKLYLTLFEPNEDYKLAVCGEQPADGYEIIPNEYVIK